MYVNCTHDWLSLKIRLFWSFEPEQKTEKPVMLTDYRTI